MSQAMTFRLPDELAERLRDTSQRTGVPQAVIVKAAVRQRLHEMDTKTWGTEIEIDSSVIKEALANPGAFKRALENFDTYRCPKDCKPNWRPTSPVPRCPACNSKTVPA